MQQKDIRPRRPMRALFAAALCLLLAGCGLFWDDPYIEVSENPLNWIEIHYYNVTREPIRRTSVRLTGGGDVQTKSGTAKAVSDDFAKEKPAATAAGYRQNRYHVPPEHVQTLFQDLVNTGLFDRDKTGTSTKYPSEGRWIAFSVAIDNKTLTCRDNVFEDDPDLAERLYNIVLEFNRPTLGARPAGTGAP